MKTNFYKINTIPGIIEITENNQKLLRGSPDASRGGFLEKSPPGRRRQKRRAK